MLGHKNLRTTQHYAKVLDRKVSDDMKILRDKMNSTINFSKAKIGGSINVTQVAGGGQHSAIIGSVLIV